MQPNGCPVYNNDNIRMAAQQVFDVLTAQPKLDAFIAVGGWADNAPEAYRQAVALQKARVDSKELVISFGDNFAPQMPLLKAGLSHYNVGQRPYEMAYKAVQVLDDILDKKAAPPPMITTGLEICTPETADFLWQDPGCPITAHTLPGATAPRPSSRITPPRPTPSCRMSTPAAFNWSTSSPICWRSSSWPGQRQDLEVAALRRLGVGHLGRVDADCGEDLEIAIGLDHDAGVAVFDRLVEETVDGGHELMLRLGC